MALASPRPAALGTDRGVFEDFLIEEARILDERRFRDWMGLFAEDGTYWVPAAPDQAPGDTYLHTDPTVTIEPRTSTLNPGMTASPALDSGRAGIRGAAGHPRSRCGGRSRIPHSPLTRPGSGTRSMISLLPT